MSIAHGLFDDFPNRRLRWWHKIPSSWLAMSPSERPDVDLEGTGSFRRRRYDDEFPPIAPYPKVQVPFGVIVTLMIYLVGQLIGGVWWAATLQSDVNHEKADRAKEEARLWQSIETYRLEVHQLRLEIARKHPESEMRRERGRSTNGEE